MTEQGTLDPPAAGTEAEGKRTSVPTRYMVLWCPKPDEDGERKWREIGWYDAYSVDGAEAKARADENSGHFGQMLDAGKQRGIHLRAIAARSWPTGEPELHTVEQPPPEWTIGGSKKEGE